MQRSSLTLCSEHEILVEGKRSQTIPIGSTSQVNGGGNGVPLTVIAEGEEIVEST